MTEFGTRNGVGDDPQRGESHTPLRRCCGSHRWHLGTRWHQRVGNVPRQRLPPSPMGHQQWRGPCVPPTPPGAHGAGRCGAVGIQLGFWGDLVRPHTGTALAGAGLGCLGAQLGQVRGPEQGQGSSRTWPWILQLPPSWISSRGTAVSLSGDTTATSPPGRRCHRLNPPL